MLGSQKCSVIVLVFIVFVLIGFVRDFLTEVNSKSKEELLMKTKMKKFLLLPLNPYLILYGLWALIFWQGHC